MADSSPVKFDRSGVPYVDYEDLIQQPEVHRQLAAARRVIDRIKSRRETAPTTADREGPRD